MTMQCAVQLLEFAQRMAQLRANPIVTPGKDEALASLQKTLVSGIMPHASELLQAKMASLRYHAVLTGIRVALEDSGTLQILSHAILAALHGAADEQATSEEKSTGVADQENPGK